MLSNEANLQREYTYFLKDHLPEGFIYDENREIPTVIVPVGNSAEIAKVVEAELRLQGYSEAMVAVEPIIINDREEIHLSFDLLYFTELQAKSCLLLVARTIYTFGSGSDTKEETSIFSFFKSKKKSPKHDVDKFKDDITKEDVIKAVRKFSDNLPDGTYRTILVNEDYSIDFSQLLRYLPRKPTQKFFMSKETYEIFEEHEAHIPPLMDKVQKAVDAYVREKKEYPLLPYDHLRRVNGYLLVQEHLLEEVPQIDFYITNYDGLVTHVKPKK
ncbi:DUF3939 domain-containing protein [Bacillus marasmi]|uniref:DUF3939 domain-containing protein n=1 Tax=Bacillus marasmi TaxID=1926279 RepID=UPI0011C9EFEE|nr:DUF3939 domain-containing protein [Bacillus marasmi]